MTGWVCRNVANNSLYGTIYRNFIGMSPESGLVNIQQNYFYGLPSLSASGQQYCPAEIAANTTHIIDAGLGNLKVGYYLGSIKLSSALNYTGYSNQGASLKDNCLTILPVGCTANQTQRPVDQCKAFCGTTPADSLSSLSSSAGAPCDGHGACLPSWVFPNGTLPPNSPPFVCNCSDGFFSVIRDGYSTCTLTAPAGED